MGASQGKIKFNLEREAWPYPVLSEYAVDLNTPSSASLLSKCLLNTGKIAFTD